MDMRELITKYVEVRAAKAKLADEHKEAMAPYNKALSGLEAVFMAHMDKAGVDSVSARDAGTVYRSTRTSATVADFDALKAYVLEHDAWHLLQARVSPVAVDAILEDTGEVVPGVNITRVMTINVRKD